ncbi:3',5'-cyclic AMP phosphodiesterase CpdA [Nocardioides luteus]|uniref:3',5'-cyclic adenosine monophosphate phosphodiesterase CpdA n=1 Tax=Nocardioides luteus TaxID=1844 RepID=A0ABQ5T1Q8_9ACTN|nr:metallophosphoesterase [Nocardioides luteus]MDR7313500.1 3',5'-cyclic AMP phosphodiesterase CpdA [Nocardioides luteus]GGR73245.1 3',5'-cyclic adenosine monophosphate phosphodiesterase CpdA [Nocardioides luteus]GLJ70041.1 3',5'-cyclic adenosine monophosphate phosphodiesterase CpdA [Nocardioides luteus]
MQFGQYPSPRHAIAHLSDPHLYAGDRKIFGKVDPNPGFELALERLRGMVTPPQALVFTGDLADLGERDAYIRLREQVEPVADELGAEIIWLMGNHDEREIYSEVLFGEASDAPQDRVHDIDGLRIIALDTTVPGWHHGDITQPQLDWLAEVLSEPAPHGTLLAMHHPPVPLPLNEASVIIELDGQDRLAPVLEGTDVRAILAGHLHYSTSTTFAGIPVSVASASCYTAAPATLDRYSASVDGHQAISLVHLYDEGAGGVPGAPVVHTTVPIGKAPEVAGFPSSVLAKLTEMTPEERRQLFSKKGKAARAARRQLRD